MIGVLLGLAAAFCWGTSDFLAARVARGIGALRALLLTQSMGLFAVGAILCWEGKVPEVTVHVVLTMLGIGLCQAVAVFLFYRAFEIGKLSLVAPITSGFAVVTAILALLSGEHPGRLALGGAVLLVMGVLLVTSQHREQNTEDEAVDVRSTLHGVPEAIAAAFLYGTVFWGLDFVVPTLGPFWPLASLRVVALTCLFGVFFLLRPAAPTESIHRLWWPAVGVAAADTFAWLAFNLGTQNADVSIVTALSSLYSAIAIFYGLLVWRERLLRVQWLGVGLILMGVLLVGIK
jgi:drug/metabolite transporter (DMT)-like permease